MRPRRNRHALVDARLIAAVALSLVALPPMTSAADAAPRARAAPVPAAAPSPSAPTPPAPAPDPSALAGSSYADPFTALGARSPFCTRPVGAAARRDCRGSGSIAHPYPISSYGIDDHVPTGITNIGDNILAALQAVAEFVWFALVLAVKGVLLLLEWALSLDLLNSTMSGVKRALETLHATVLGRPWFVFALSAAGLWGIWRGLVQRRTIETIGGLAATVGLMLVALVLISDPGATIGHASKLADQGALGVIAGASGGSVDQPEQSFATAVEGLFRTTVLGPWAALEFGDTRWALSSAKPGSRVTNADVWLSFPANSSQRTALYELQQGGGGDSGGVVGAIGTALGAATDPVGQALAILRGGSHPSVPGAVASYVHKDPSKVRIQEAGGTFPRLALLVLIAIGLCGAILLFLYVGVKLLLASVMSLLLVLLAPAMLLAPAFGQSGRATTVAWTRRLAAALAAKLIYSLLLAILLVASAAIESLAVGWFATWLILIAFWWGALLKRHDLVGFVSIGHARPAGGPAATGRMLRTFYALRLASAAVGARRGRPPEQAKRRLPPHRRHPGLPVADAPGDERPATSGAVADAHDGPASAATGAVLQTATAYAPPLHQSRDGDRAAAGETPPAATGDASARQQPPNLSGRPTPPPARSPERPRGKPSGPDLSPPAPAPAGAAAKPPAAEPDRERPRELDQGPVQQPERRPAAPVQAGEPGDPSQPAETTESAGRPIDHREHLRAVLARRRMLAEGRSSRRPSAR